MMTLALISESFALLTLIWTIAYATQLAVTDLLWLVEARRQDVEYAWWSRASLPDHDRTNRGSPGRRHLRRDLRMNTALKVIGSIVGTLVLVVFLTAIFQATPRASQPPAPVEQALSSAGATGPLTTFSDGSYLVGTDIVAGTYTSPGPTDSAIPWCYWERAMNDSGAIDSIISNDGGDGPRRFTAMPGEVVKIQGCTFTVAS
jgi:hypothetical protein